MAESVGDVVSQAKATGGMPKALVDGLIGLPERLEAMHTVLGIVAQDLEDREKVSALLTEAQHTMTEAVGELHTLCTDIVMQLDRLNQRREAPGAPRSRWRQWWLRWSRACATAGGLLLLATGAWWQWWPDTRWSPLGRMLDAVVVRQWKGFSAEQQAQFQRLYNELRVQAPSERQDGGKK